MFLRISVFFLATCLALSAQEPRSLEVRTLCFSYSHGKREVSVAGDPEGKSQVEFKLLKYLKTSQEKMTVIDGHLLLDGEPGGGEAGELGQWGKVPIPKGMKEVLLVFLPLDDPEKPYRVIVFDDSSKAFPLGSFLIVNLSPTSLRLVVGGTQVHVEPGSNKLIAEFKQKKANGKVSYYAYSQQGEDWDRLSTGFWSVVPRKRNLQIAFGNPKTKAIEMRGFSDGLPIVRALLEQQAKRQAK